MLIRTEQISEEGLVIEFEEPSTYFEVLADLVKEGQCEFLAPVSAVLRAQRFGDIVEVEGRTNTTVRLACGRCLQKFETQLESRFILTYKKGIPHAEPMASNQEEIELEHEDINLIYHQGEDIDLQNEIQEQVVMSFPLRALCKPDCKGLCPKCGSDLNKGDCSCTPTSSADKFDALKNLNLNGK